MCQQVLLGCVLYQFAICKGITPSSIPSQPRKIPPNHYTDSRCNKGRRPPPPRTEPPRAAVPPPQRFPPGRARRGPRGVCHHAGRVLCARGGPAEGKACGVICLLIPYPLLWLVGGVGVRTVLRAWVPAWFWCWEMDAGFLCGGAGAEQRGGGAFEPRAVDERCDAVGFAFAYYLVGTALWARFGPGLGLGEGGDEGVVLTYVRTAVCCLLATYLSTYLPTHLPCLTWLLVGC